MIFPEELYMQAFIMGTFFHIGYGDQVPTDWSCPLVGLEALSSFLLEMVFLA